jgi:hypothetical protein
MDAASDAKATNEALNKRVFKAMLSAGTRTLPPSLAASRHGVEAWPSGRGVIDAY